MKRVVPFCTVALLAAVLPLSAQEAKVTAATDAAAAAKAEVKKEPLVKLVQPRGVYADFAEVEFSPMALLSGGMQKPKPFYDLIDKLTALADDKEANEILFDLSSDLALNQPQLVELDRCMEKLRSAGKKTWAYLENASNAQYQIAARCDKILMADMGTLDIHSPALNVMYMRDVLDFLGVQMDVLRCGDFKGAAEPFMLSRMSPHLRAHYEEMLTSMNDDFVARLAQARGIEREKVREMQKQRLFTADKALAAGLVDKLVPWEGAKRALAKTMGTEAFELDDILKKQRKSINIMALMTEMFAPKKTDKLEDDSIVVLHLAGAIVDGDSAQPGMMVSGPTVKAIRELIADDKVKAVVARVNSPGGSATASEAIRRALVELAEKKPVVYSMGRVAGSGGYWITCVGKPILAEVGTITGSIGVLGYKPNMGPLMRRIGVHEEFVALDDAAGMQWTGRGWTDAEKEQLQGFMNSIYDRFVAQAAASRNMTQDEVRAIAGGRVFSGEQAVNNRLIDKIGGMHDAVAMVAKEAGLTDYKVVHRPHIKDPVQAIVDSMMDAEVAMPALIELPAEARKLMQSMPSLAAPLAILREAMRADRPMVWALMPCDLNVRF